MAEFYFPWKQVNSDNSTSLSLTSSGTGTGVGQLMIRVSSPIILTLDGAGRFYSDSAGTLNESTTYNVNTINSTVTIYIKCTSGTSTLTFSNRYSLTHAGVAINYNNGNSFWSDVVDYANYPILNCNNFNFPNCVNIYTGSGKYDWTCNINKLPTNLIYFVASGYGIYVSGDILEINPSCEIFSITSGYITGNLSSLSSSMREFNITTSNIITGNLAFLSSTIDVFIVVGSNTITGDIHSFPEGVVTIQVEGLNTIYGDIADSPSTVTFMIISGNNTIIGDIANLPININVLIILGLNTVNGNIVNLPSSIGHIDIEGSNTITGDIHNIPNDTYSFIIKGSNTISGTIDSSMYSKTTITLISVTGNNTITGDVSYAPVNIYAFEITGNNTISAYTSGRSWTAFMLKVIISSPYGTLSSTEVDNLLINLSSANWATSGQINISGSNAARTSASDSAVATLISKSVDLILNT